MRYLVTASEGPGFASAKDTIEVLETEILPTFAALKRLEEKRKIVAGGLPVGDRAFIFIVEAASNQDLDELLRNPPSVGRPQVARDAAAELRRPCRAGAQAAETAQAGTLACPRGSV